MHSGTVGCFAAMGEAVLHVPVRQRNRAIRPLLDHGTGDALFPACPRSVDDYGLVALLDDELGRANEGRLAAHADQRCIQRVIGDQPQSAAGAEHVGALVAVEGEDIAGEDFAAAHGDVSSR